MSTTIIAALVTTAPKDLAADLAAVKPAVGTRSCVRALTGVRIFTSDGYAYAETTDMTTFARRRMTITVSGDMDIIVSHVDLTKAVKLFAKRGIVALDLADDGRLAVTDGARTINLRTLSREDWPEFPTGDMRELFTSPDGKALSAVLLRAARFASKDETRPILTGIAFNHAGEGLRAWSTDSYRLADLAVPAENVRPAEPGNLAASLVNVDAAGIVMAAKAMVKAGPVAVYTRPNHAVVEFGRETWAIRIVAGQFPNFAQLIPDRAEMTVKVPVAELAGACDVAVAFARKNAPMRLRVNGTAEVTGVTPGEADFRELLPGAVITKAEPDATPRTVVGQAPAVAEDDVLEVGLNPEFVRDIAAAHVGETAEVRLISGLRPVLFVDDGDLYLQMPIRLKV